MSNDKSKHPGQSEKPPPPPPQPPPKPIEVPLDTVNKSLREDSERKSGRS